MKDVFKKLLTHIESGILVRGLCETLTDMVKRGIITSEQSEEAKAYIKEHRPFFPMSYNGFTDKDAYFWPQWDKEPRIKWLHKHINKL